MKTFDLYFPAGTPSEGFFAQPLSSGTMVWIDKAGAQTGELLEFAVINGGLASLPRDASAFEKIPFIEAEVLEPNDQGAKIVLRSVSTLGEWARGVYTLGKSTFFTIPEASRPGPALLEPLYAQFRSREGAVWVADAPPADPAAPSAVFLFKCDFDKRAAVLTSASNPSYLVKL